MFEEAAKFKDSILFANPEYLFWGLFTFLAAFSLLSFIVRKLNAPELSYGSKSPLIGKIKFFGFFALLVFLFSMIALARPYTEHGSISVRRGAVEVNFIVDNSGSMIVKDVGKVDGHEYARIDAVSRALTDLYSKNVIREGDRVGVFVFGLSSRAKVYPTRDLTRFVNEVSKLGRPEYLNADTSYWGSDVALVLEDVYKRLDRFDKAQSNSANWKPEPRSNRLIIFLSDGDFDFINSPSEDAEYSVRLGKVLEEYRIRQTRIYSVGVGSVKETPLESIFKDYVAGKDYDPALAEELKGVNTRFRPEGLELIARQTGGEVPILRLEKAGQDISAELARIIDSRRSTSVEMSKDREKQELWRYALYIALFIAALGIIFY